MKARRTNEGRLLHMFPYLEQVSKSIPHTLGTISLRNLAHRKKEHDTPFQESVSSSQHIPQGETSKTTSHNKGLKSFKLCV